MHRILALFTLLACFAFPMIAQEAEQNIHWCVNDQGAVDCPEQYLALGQPMIAACAVSGGLFDGGGGGRSCLMDIAIAAAHHDQCAVAFGLSLICQCHNGHAQDTIRNYGIANTCQFLKGYTSYTEEAIAVAQALSGLFAN